MPVNTILSNAGKMLKNLLRLGYNPLKAYITN